MLGLLFVLAVIVIAIALLPQALGVLSSAMPWVIGTVALVVHYLPDILSGLLGIALLVAFAVGGYKLISFLWPILCGLLSRRTGLKVGTMDVLLRVCVLAVSASFIALGWALNSDIVMSLGVLGLVGLFSFSIIYGRVYRGV